MTNASGSCRNPQLAAGRMDGLSGLPCAEEEVPGYLIRIGNYVKSAQARASERDAEVERLCSEVDRLEGELALVRQHLNQSKAQRLQQDEQVRRLTEQLEDAGRASEVMATAHEEELQAASAQARQLTESRDGYASRLAHAEQQGRDGEAEARRAAGHAQQLERELAATQRELERERSEKDAAQQEAAQARQIQNEAACLQHRLAQERRQKEAAFQGTASAQELQQQIAALQQELEVEREQKEAALKAKASYKLRAIEYSNQYRLVKNSYKRLRKEKGVDGGGPHSSVQGGSRQLASTDTPPPEPEDDGIEGEGTDSEEQRQYATGPSSRGATPKAVLRPTSGGQRQSMLHQAGGPSSSKPKGAAEQPSPCSVQPARAASGQQPASMEMEAPQACQPAGEPSGQPYPAAGEPDREKANGTQEAASLERELSEAGMPTGCRSQPAAGSQLRPSTVRPTQVGTSDSQEPVGGQLELMQNSQRASGCNGSRPQLAVCAHPNPSASHPTQGCTSDSQEPVGMQHRAQRAVQQELEQQQQQQLEWTCSSATKPPAECAIPPCPADAVVEALPFAGEPAAAGPKQAMCKEPSPAPLQQMPPPAPRPRPPAAAAGFLVGRLHHRSSPPWQQQQQEQQPAQPWRVPIMDCETQVTQPDTMRNLLQLAKSPPPPQQRQGQKRPAPLPPAWPQDELPSKQTLFDRGQAPTWGPAGIAAAAPEPLLAGCPAWKKAARPSSAEVLAFNTTGLHPRQQQLAWQQGGLPSTAADQFPLPPRPWQGRADGGSIAVGGQGTDSGPAKEDSVGYKYQDVVRKRDERAKLKGVECLQCKRFYEALESWGTIATGNLPACGHVSDQDLGLTSAAAGAGPQLLSREELREAGSRHRYRYEPPATPQDYWNMDFTPATSQA